MFNKNIIFSFKSEIDKNIDLISPTNVKLSRNMSAYQSHKYGEKNYMQIPANDELDPQNTLTQILSTHNPNNISPTPYPIVQPQVQSSFPSK